VILIDVSIATVAGVAAGIINTAIGSGSLITYPALVLIGLPPVAANITNTIGLAPGALAGAWAYRRELRTQKRAIVQLLPVSALGAAAGAALLLVLPRAAFEVAVPVLILIAVLLVALQPVVAARVQRGRDDTRWAALGACVLGASIYGGYFGAAQGVILLALLGIFLSSTMQSQNAVKNLLQATVNVVAATFFLVTGGAHLGLAACVAAGSLVGAPIGARLARRLPPRVFRYLIVVFGCVVAAVLIVT
jgi:uncharacterized membrane protein YfcA